MEKEDAAERVLALLEERIRVRELVREGKGQGEKS
jgi:hypothetical protein